MVQQFATQGQVIKMSRGRQLCEQFTFLPSRVLVIVLAVLQGGVLDYYLVQYNNHSWFFWIAADVAVIFSFLVAFFISYRELKIVHQMKALSLSSEKKPKTETVVDAGSFPLSYFAWLVYSVMLTVRVAIIYKNFAYRIDDGIFFGTNMLKFTIALSGIQFILMVSAHHNALPGTQARNLINGLTVMVPFDLMDSVDILTIFFNEGSKNSLEDIFEYAIIIIASVNIVLSTVPLMILSGSHFGVHPISMSIRSLHQILQIGAINGPLLFLRIFMWHKQGEEVSLFILKNIVVIVLIGMEVYERGYEKAESQEEVLEDDEEAQRDDKRHGAALVPYSHT